MFPKNAAELGFNGTLNELCANTELIELLWRDIFKQGQEEGLHGFEQVRRIQFLPESMQVNDLVTDTFKLKRFHAKEFFKEQIKDMYSKKAFNLRN